MHTAQRWPWSTSRLMRSKRMGSLRPPNCLLKVAASSVMARSSCGRARSGMGGAGRRGATAVRPRGRGTAAGSILLPRAMKITRVTPHVLEAPITNAFYYSQGYYPSRTAVLLEVRTDDGLVGWGQAAGAPATLPVIVERQYAPLVVGKDPRDWRVLWHKLGGLRGGHYGVISGLEIAFLDLAGKAAWPPISPLLRRAGRQRG